jgi:hypothetical protein
MDAQRSRGQMYMELMFSAEEIGITVPEPRPDRALQIFLDVSSGATYTAIAPRVSQMPKGVLFCSSVAGRPDSGAIYIYSREWGEFYMVMFTDGRETDLTVPEYEKLVHEYGLLEYAADPNLIYKVLWHRGKPIPTA